MAIIATAMSTAASDAAAQAADPAPLPVTQRVHVRSLSPPYGVLAQVDDGPTASLVVGEQLDLDDRGHFLTLTCVRDMCEPAGVWVKPGASLQEVDVALMIRPAVLQIEGNLAHRFAIQEEPSLGCGCVGVPMSVPLSSGERVVHVTDVQSKQTIAVVLTAGHTTLVSFF